MSKPVFFEIDGLSQVEIENKFSGNEAKEQLYTDYEVFYANATDLDIKPMYSILNTDDSELVNEVFLFILGMIGNPLVGVKALTTLGGKQKLNDEDVSDNVRDIVVQNLISGLGKCRPIQSHARTNSHAFNYAMDIVAEYDGTLWDLHKVSARNKDNQWITITYARTELLFETDTQALGSYHDCFRLPMLETPDKWEVGLSGGYKLNKSKVTTNKGEGSQPQEVLDVLNTLQNNAYKLADHVNANEEFIYNTNKLNEQLEDKSEAQKRAFGMCTTNSQTYQVLKDREFYFEWKYDFRGRAYNTGYDVTLQGNSYKKGSLKPCFK